MSEQFDVCRVMGLNEGSAVDLAVVLQDDMLADLSTRVVAPLIEMGDHHRASSATPGVNVEGVNYIVAVHLMTTLPRRNLSSPVASLIAQEAALKRALDLLFFGV